MGLGIGPMTDIFFWKQSAHDAPSGTGLTFVSDIDISILQLDRLGCGKLQNYLDKMLSKTLLLCSLCLIFAVLSLDSGVEARYLPTRANGDRVDKLREMLKELLESEIEKEEMGDVPRWHPESKLFYKREAPAVPSSKPDAH
ncbi:hypothetical protein JTB14_001947 [Gonioctena quinquepunctata]|nr:hypothetical protein JTB14_001947 [Gonioctena quinquepunctata]